MPVTKNDKILEGYSGSKTLDANYLNTLKAALLECQSGSLRQLLSLAIIADQPDYTRLPETGDIVKSGQMDHFHQFFSEAIERLTIARSVISRSRQNNVQDKDFTIVARMCERAIRIHRSVSSKFTASQTDRLLRAITLSTEDLSAATAFLSEWKFFQSALIIPEDVRDNDERTALYWGLINRLELSASQTFGKIRSDRSALFF